MKKLLSVLLTWGVITFLSGASSIAAEKEPAVKDGESIKSKSVARSIPFRGKIDKVDLKTKTITVGKRVFHLTEKTKIIKDGQPAKLSDAELGEKIGGAYFKEADDKLVAVSVRFGDKPAEKPKAKKSKEETKSES